MSLRGPAAPALSLGPLPDRRSLLLGAAAAGGCATLPRASAAPFPPAEITPAQRAAFDRAAAFSAESGGSAVLVLQGGRLLYEAYGPEGGPEVRSTLASGAKSFWGVAAAMMIADGLISGWDELAADTLPEWRGHSRKSRITLRQLLSLSSGLANEGEALQGHGSAANKYAYSLQAEAETPPGERFAYGPVNYYVLGEIMRRKLQGRYRDPLHYLDERLLKPLGVGAYDWLRDPSGNPHMPNGASMTARDWARFGQMLLDGGVWRGRRLVDAALLRDVSAPSTANPSYGLTVWLNRRTADPEGSVGGVYPRGMRDIFSALGAGPNMLCVVPSLKAVIVRRRPHRERPREMSMQQLGAYTERQTGAFKYAVFLDPILTSLAPA